MFPLWASLSPQAGYVTSPRDTGSSEGGENRLQAMPGDRIEASCPLPGSFGDLARLGALHRTVWDDLGQLHNPVVDLVSAAALHCGAKGRAK